MKFRLLILAACIFSLGAAAHAGDAADSPSLLRRYATGAQEIVMRALALVGARYRSGGESPAEGFDCSGLVQHVFRETLGLRLPREAKQMSRRGETIAPDELKPGDLVFYNTLHRAFSHVGIYLGEHRFVHAPSSGGEVRIDDMRESYWVKRFNGARRVAQLGDAPSVAATAPATGAAGAITPAPASAPPQALLWGPLLGFDAPPAN